MRYLHSLARIFTTSFARRILKNDINSFLVEMIDYFPFLNEVVENDDYKLLYEKTYDILREDYRNEYIYKTVFYIDSLRRKEQNNELNVLTELRIGSSIADLVSIKDIGITLEIKSDVDNIKKSITQVNEYQKMFPYVSLLSEKKKIDSIKDIISTDIGLFCLNEDLSVEKLRAPKFNNNKIDFKTMFYTLRRSEYENIVRKYYSSIPEMPNGDIFQYCFDVSSKIPIEEFVLLFNREIKKRTNEEDVFIDTIPDYFIFLGCKGALKKSEKKALLEKIY